jgi:hypothetical protein
MRICKAWGDELMPGCVVVEKSDFKIPVCSFVVEYLLFALIEQYLWLQVATSEVHGMSFSRFYHIKQYWMFSKEHLRIAGVNLYLEPQQLVIQRTSPPKRLLSLTFVALWSLWEVFGPSPRSVCCSHANKYFDLSLFKLKAK